MFRRASFCRMHTSERMLVTFSSPVRSSRLSFSTMESQYSIAVIPARPAKLSREGLRSMWMSPSIVVTPESPSRVANNVVYQAGNTGMAAWDSAASGSFVNNVVTGCGNVDEWVAKQTGVWMNSDGVVLAYNDIWDNNGQQVCTGGSPEGFDCTPVEFDGIDGNISQDPLFVDTEEYEPAGGSPLLDAGDPGCLDTDGSRSDMGIHGGPNVGATDPR